jgi:hypothetical protein
MDYTTLLTNVQSTVQNYEPTFVATIPQMVRTVENRLFTDPELELPVEQNSATLSTGIGVQTLSLTGLTRFVAVDSVALDLGGGAGYVYLDSKEEELLRTAFPDPTVTARPRLYVLYDTGALRLAPTPDAVYSVVLRYFSIPESIVDAASGRTWLGDTFDDVLLYGVLCEAGVYMKEEADVQTMYEGKYKAAYDRLANFARNKAKVDAYRTRSKR